MTPSRHVTVRIDLARVRRNAEEIARKTGVAVHAVVKSDAYGLGAQRVAAALREVVAGFCIFSLFEASEAKLWHTAGKPILVLGPPGKAGPDHYLAAHARPAVSTAEDARRLRPALPVLCVDTGQQRFACPVEEVDAALEAGLCREAFTHAIRMHQVETFTRLVGGRGLTLHAAGSALLDEPSAWLNGVRPGIAIYRGATRVSVPLVEARTGRGPAGYTGFVADRFGVVLCGYSNGLRVGPCLVNGVRRRVLEVGMQSAFVELGSGDHVGDEVTLLGDGLTESDVASAWGVSEQEALVRLAGAGVKKYE